MLILDQLRRWNKDRKDIAALQAMSNRQLSDLGITRSEITARVRNK